RPHRPRALTDRCRPSRGKGTPRRTRASPRRAIPTSAASGCRTLGSRRTRDPRERHRSRRPFVLHFPSSSRPSRRSFLVSSEREPAQLIELSLRTAAEGAHDHGHEHDKEQTQAYLRIKREVCCAHHVREFHLSPPALAVFTGACSEGAGSTLGFFLRSVPSRWRYAVSATIFFPSSPARPPCFSISAAISCA